MKNLRSDGEIGKVEVEMGYNFIQNGKEKNNSRAVPRHKGKGRRIRDYPTAFAMEASGCGSAPPTS